MAFILTTKEVANILGISTTHVGKLRDAGILKAIRTGKGTYLYDDETVYRYAFGMREKLPYVVIYIRVENEKDTEEINRQRRICETLCDIDKTLKMLNRKIFVDIGGKLLATRKHFDKFVHFVRKHKVRHVIVSEKEIFIDMPDEYLSELLTLINMFMKFELIFANEHLKKIKDNIEEYMKICEKIKCDEIVK